MSKSDKKLITIELTELETLDARVALAIVMERRIQFGISEEDFMEVKSVFDKMTKKYQAIRTA